jgi:kinesin family protein 5
MLKKAKTQILTFTQYITVLEGEVKIWRTGGVVPEEQWATMEKAKTEALPAPPPAPKTGSPPQTTSPPHTPVGKAVPDRLMESVSRASTPYTLVEDEREEFMKRENELNDLLTQKV